MATEQSSAGRLATEKANDTVRAEGNNTEGKPVDMGDRLDNDDSSTGSMKEERTHNMENEAQTSKWLNSMAETDRGLG